MSDPLAPDPFHGLFWLTAKQAAIYVCCRNVKSWYQRRKRHGILTRNNGTVNKADLERELKRRKPRRVMHVNSIRNLQRAHGRSTPIADARSPVRDHVDGGDRVPDSSCSSDRRSA
jgi:hypothetical protein